MPSRSSTAESPDRELRRLRRRVDQLECLCADIYQFIGRANAPLRFLDATAAAASGWPLPRKPLKNLTKREKAALALEFGDRG